ncbi:MAG: DNA helicase UvrD [Nitrospirae bacterium]|nr:MAG: DNA helicase UvrD [Nitrospirota bacterium]
MPFFADLHIHSRYSRATSRDMSPEGIWKWAQLKGISVIGTGDFTHPAWLAELREKLEPDSRGLFSLKKDFRTDGIPGSCLADVSFLLTAEISCIYRKNDRTRKIHLLVYVPAFGDAERINTALSAIGNLRSDGRPILGLDAKELLKIVLDHAPEAIVVPAHAWTPHFSLFGSMSGFDAIEDCFEELTSHICAIETGLSSDPGMNRRLSALDRITLISNSDAHSPSKIGREASIFDTETSYPAMRDALRSGRGLSGTVEFFPEEGKYHHDGHRNCGVNLSPEETIRHNGLCPVCGKKVTVGVMHRVRALADREAGSGQTVSPPYYPVIPLTEIISEILGVGPASKAVSAAYFGLLQKLGSELPILLDLPLGEVEAASSPIFAKALGKMRSGDISITPGYDGEFGKVKIFAGPVKKAGRGQRPLF